jgi:hypothetical protein
MWFCFTHGFDVITLMHYLCFECNISIQSISFLTQFTSICFTLNNTHEYVSFRKDLCLLCNRINCKFNILICWHNAWRKWMNPMWIFFMGGKNINHGKFISWVYKCSFFSFITCVCFLEYFSIIWCKQ